MRLIGTAGRSPKPIIGEPATGAMLAKISLK